MVDLDQSEITPTDSSSNSLNLMLNSQRLIAIVTLVTLFHGIRTRVAPGISQTSMNLVGINCGS